MITSGYRNLDSLRELNKSIELTLGDLSLSSNRACITESVINKCVTDYLQSAKYSLLPVSKKRCEEFFRKNLKTSFVAIIKKHETVVGFVIATTGFSEVSDVKFLQQTFYNSILTGTAAVKAVWIAHRALIAYAEKYKYAYILSTCSAYDTDFTFNRILTKDGWHSVGHSSVYKIGI